MGKKLQWIIFHNFFNMESKNKCFQGNKTEVLTNSAKGKVRRNRSTHPTELSVSTWRSQLPRTVRVRA